MPLEEDFVDNFMGSLGPAMKPASKREGGRFKGSAPRREPASHSARGRTPAALCLAYWSAH